MQGCELNHTTFQRFHDGCSKASSQTLVNTVVPAATNYSKFGVTPSHCAMNSQGHARGQVTVGMACLCSMLAENQNHVRADLPS